MKFKKIFTLFHNYHIYYILHIVSFYLSYTFHTFLYIQILLKCTNIYNLIIIILYFNEFYLFFNYIILNEVNVYSNNNSTLIKKKENKQEQRDLQWNKLHILHFSHIFKRELPFKKFSLLNTK